MKKQKKKSFDNGVEDYTSKPTDLKELREKIKKWTSVDKEITPYCN